MSNADVTDPITTEIIRSAFVAITDEMKTNLMRTAHNPVIYEALDYTVGLFDATGDTLSIGLGLPSFIGGLAIPFAPNWPSMVRTASSPATFF